MPRKLRVEFEGACYHVINRGNYRRNLFAGEGAAEAFEGVLFEACARFGWRLHAYVVMRNHFHLAVETPVPNLSVGMKWLQGTWAARFNRWRGEVGRPFQGRFKALLVEPGHVLAQVAHYIHLNPVRAGVVKAEGLGEFRWSSFFWLLQGKKRPAVLALRPALAESGGLADTPAGWRSYGEYLGLLAEEDPKERERKYGRMSRGWAIGTAGFKAELREKLDEEHRATAGAVERYELLGGGPEARRELREEAWEETLQAEAKRQRIDLKRLPAKKSADEKVRLAAVLKETTDVANGWLAKRLAMGEAASVSQFVRRYRLAGEGKQRG